MVSIITYNNPPLFPNVKCSFRLELQQIDVLRHIKDPDEGLSSE